MAAARTRTEKRLRTAQRRGARSRGMKQIFLPLVFVAGGALALLPTTIVTIVGLVPSFVALTVDVTPNRYLFRTVAGFNTAALMPFLMQLWRGNNDVLSALTTVMDLYFWFMVYVMAGLGWVMFLGMPSVVASFRTFSAEHHITRLKAEQEELIEEWQDALTGVDPAASPASEKPQPATPPQPATDRPAAATPRR